MAELTKKEIEEETKLAAIENRAPDFSGRVKKDAAPDPEPDLADDIFTAADLSTDAMLGRCEKYTMPNGKAVYVFPLDTETYQWVLEWSTHLEIADDPEADVDNDLSKTRQQFRIFASQLDVLIYHVIACCHRKPDRNSPRCFGRQHFEKLRKGLPYPVVQEICRLSDTLAGNPEKLSPGVKAFFTGFQSCLMTCSGVLGNSTDCPDGLKATLTQLGSLVSRVLRRGVLDAAACAELAEM